MNLDIKCTEAYEIPGSDEVRFVFVKPKDGEEDPTFVKLEVQGKTLDYKVGTFYNLGLL